MKTCVWLYSPCIYSQLSPCGHLAITDTPLLRTAGITEKNSAITNFLYYGHQILVPMVSVITRVDYKRKEHGKENLQWMNGNLVCGCILHAFEWKVRATCNEWTENSRKTAHLDRAERKLRDNSLEVLAHSQNRLIVSNGSPNVLCEYKDWLVEWNCGALSLLNCCIIQI